MPTLQDPVMIITDLDGSLLDHHTYSWQPAETWLARLHAQHIPLVICSSKTAAEIVPLQDQLGIAGAPFIAENGALVQWDDGSGAGPFRESGGTDYATLCRTLQRLKQQHGFRFIGFAEVSEKEVSDWTGLAPHQAALARQREASESLIWRDSEERFTEFRQHLAQQDLTLIQGGRFWSVVRSGCGKGAALRWLLQHYPHPAGPPLTIGLGDGPNDAEMLDAVDYAVVIKGYSKNPVILQRQDKHSTYHTEHFGPEGWCEGLEHFITQ